MRRKDRQIEDRAELYALLDKAGVMRLALWDGREPYVVPLNFVRMDDAVYFHSAASGRKVEILRERPLVCFVVEGASEVLPGIDGGDCTTIYESVIGWGNASFIEEEAEKNKILSALNRKFGAKEGPFPSALLARTAVVRVAIDRMTGKANRGRG
jgi:hypothetical protein